MELAAALRWLGFPRSIAEVMEIMEDCDVDGNQGLDKGEFRKLCAGLRDEEMRTIRKTFRTYAKSTHLTMSFADLRKFLAAIGRSQSADAIVKVLSPPGSGVEDVDLWTFALVAKKFRTEAR